MLKIAPGYLNSTSKYTIDWDNTYLNVNAIFFFGIVLYSFKPYAKFMKNHDMLNVPYKVVGV